MIMGILQKKRQPSYYSAGGKIKIYGQYQIDWRSVTYAKYRNTLGE